jgi:hypothetical protein
MAPSAEIATNRRIGFGRALAVREDGRSALLYFARKEPNFGLRERNPILVAAPTPKSLISLSDWGARRSRRLSRKPKEA